MTNTGADLLIISLLLIGTGFGIISLMGLLIFPDIRSRLYTSLRAGVISCAAIVAAAVTFSLVHLSENGGNQYSVLLFHTALLLGIVLVGTLIVNRVVLEKTHGFRQCSDTKTKEKKSK